MGELVGNIRYIFAWSVQVIRQGLWFLLRGCGSCCKPLCQHISPMTKKKPQKSPTCLWSRSREWLVSQQILHEFRLHSGLCGWPWLCGSSQLHHVDVLLVISFACPQTSSCSECCTPCNWPCRWLCSRHPIPFCLRILRQILKFEAA